LKANIDIYLRENKGTISIIFSNHCLQILNSICNLRKIFVAKKLENPATTIATDALPKGIYIITIGDELKKIVLE